MTSQRRGRVGAPGVKHERRRRELAVDGRVPLVVELEVEAAVARHVAELDERQLLHRRGDAEVEPSDSSSPRLSAR